MIIDPILWNIMFDRLFSVSLPDGITVVSGANNLPQVVPERTEELLMDEANIALLCHIESTREV